MGVTLLEIVKDYASRAVFRQKNVTVSAMIEGFLESHRRRNSSGPHISTLKTRLGHFSKEFGANTMACDIKREEIALWVSNLEYAPETINNTIREIRSCFEWAKGQGFIPANPLDVTKDLRHKIIRGEPSVLPVDDFAALLKAANPDVLPYFAIAGFGGIRPDELIWVEWGDVYFDEGQIKVRAEIAKTGKARFVKIEPALAAFLVPYVGRKGRICTRSFRRLFREARWAVGFGTPKDEKKFGREFKPWPDDVLRHSFGSYHIAQFNDAGATALQMGHQGTAVLFDHYRALVTPKEAKRFWALRPVKD